jgi:hypothetical protein
MDNTDAAPPADEDLSTLLATVRDRLDATAELPVSPDASPWLGEAAAVAEQATDPALDREGVATRLDHLDRLLDGPAPDNPEVERHVAAARTALDAARARLAEDDARAETER